jgi:acetyltransferase-like isoleucine patch superfamily enzyme
VDIHDEVMIRSNATILQYVSVGAGAIVGAGAVVTKDVASQLKLVGIPAKPMMRSMSSRPRPQLLEDILDDLSRR